MHFDVLGEFDEAENDDLSLNIKGDNIKLEEIFSVFLRLPVCFKSI